MKRIAHVPIMIFLILLISCSGPKDPTFEKFENIKVNSISARSVSLNAEMVLNNPNPFSCHLKNLHLEIFSENDVKLTEINQTFNTEMVARSNFSVPVKISFSPKKLLDEKEGLLSSVLSVLSEKEVTLKYKGTCGVEVMEINVKVPVEYEEKMVLKKE